MVKLIWIVIAGLLLGAAAWWGLGSESYLLLRLGDWALQVSIWTAILALILVWLVVALLRLALTGFGLFDWVRHHRDNRRRKQYRSQVVAYYQGDWKAAARGLLKVAEVAEDPVPSLLMGAIATARSGDLPAALNILENLESAYPVAAQASTQVRARLYLDYQQFDAAREAVARLRELKANPVEINLIEARLAQLSGDLPGLQKSLRSLPERRLHRADFQGLQRYYAFLELSRADIDTDEVKRLLATLDAASLTDESLLDLILSRLQKMKGDEAASILVGLIEQTWHPRLIAAYGEVETSQPRKQLKRAERWHTTHLSVELLETLQKLAWRADDTDRARDYAQQMRVLRRSRDD